MLRAVDLGRCTHFVDLTQLGRPPALECLTLSGISKARDLRPIGELRTLKSLKLSGIARTFSLSALANLSRLTTLTIDEARQPLDLSPLAQMTHLERLTITDVQSVTGAAALASLINLIHLELGCHGKNDVDLSDISSARLTVLHLQGFAENTDLAFLNTLQSLQSLWLEGFQSVTDITPIQFLVNLKSLVLSGFDSLVNLEPLATISQLRVVVTTSGECRLDTFQRLLSTDLRVKTGQALDSLVKRYGLVRFDVKAGSRSPHSPTGVPKQIEGTTRTTRRSR